jgi:hypothetical protein
MPARTVTAAKPGPVLIDVELFGAGGVVTVRTDPARTQAEITIRTADETGEWADAVRDADLRWDSRGALIAHVHGTGAGGTTVVSGNGTQVLQSFGTIHGSVTGMVIHGRIDNLTKVGRNVYINGQLVRPGQAAGPSPIEITAVVPEGGSLAAYTHSADVTADGVFVAVSTSTQSGDVRIPGPTERITATTQSGDVVVDNAPHMVIRTQSGDIRLGRTDLVEAHTQSGDITIRDFGGSAQLNSMSGDIRVHATAGGDLTAQTMSGDITVTATTQAAGDDLNVNATSMSGDVRTPQRPTSTAAGPRRRRN